MTAIKTGLALTAIATIGIMVLYNMDQGLNVKPENLVDCDQGAAYTLQRINFVTDDIIKGKPAKMVATFKATKDGSMKEFTMTVYKVIKLWS